jgi:hypothetical protein
MSVSLGSIFTLRRLRIRPLAMVLWALALLVGDHRKQLAVVARMAYVVVHVSAWLAHITATH